MGTLAESAEKIARGEASSRDIVEESLRAAEKLQPSLNAFTMFFPDEALDAAVRADEAAVRGETLGPLHGVPIAVKDAYDVAGTVTSGCCHAYRTRVATSDADAVAALRAAGAIVI